LLNPKEDQKSEEMKKALNQKIYLERNLMMADRIELFLNNEQRYFIVIGAGHLIGEEDNILQLLGQKGFQVEQY
ncbi:MAG TPA: TraB/GumN family protein, partial [Fibrobacter sp.]|nr:TraB/GumN family protein [Fibrobacter sp.]